MRVHDIKKQNGIRRQKKNCVLDRPGPCEHAEREVAGSEAEAGCRRITLGAVELLGDQYIGYK